MVQRRIIRKRFDIDFFDLIRHLISLQNVAPYYTNSILLVLPTINSTNTLL